MKTLLYFPLALLIGCWFFLPRLAAQEPAFYSTSGVGSAGEDAGMAIAHLDANELPDLLLLTYDAATGPNEFKYKIGNDLDANGRPQRWGETFTVSGVGNAGEGAAIAVANIDANARPDLLLMGYNSQPGGNEFRYRLGLNLNTTGAAAPWGPVFCIPGVGDHAEGAGMALADLNQNNLPDLVLMAYDAENGLNTFRYRVGKDLDANGRTRNWSGMTIVDGVGQPADGAGMAIGDYNKNGLPDMLLMAYLSNGATPSFRYKIGFDLDAYGNASTWTDVLETTGTGDQAEGADVILYDLNHDELLEAIFMAYRASTFRFKTAELMPIK